MKTRTCPNESNPNDMKMKKNLKELKVTIYQQVAPFFSIAGSQEFHLDW